MKAAIEALQRVRDEVSGSERRPPSMILLSDRSISSERAALPALLALAAAWKALVSAGGCDVPLIIETGQVIETHHLAMLIAAVLALSVLISRWSFPKALKQRALLDIAKPSMSACEKCSPEWAFARSAAIAIASSSKS